MTRTTSYLELKPEHVEALIDVFDDLYNHEQPRIELSHFAHIFYQLTDMKKHVHWCEECNTEYFDQLSTVYRLVCDECNIKKKEENE